MTIGTARATYKRDWEARHIVRRTSSSSPALTNAEVIAWIRRDHLKAHFPGTPLWDLATVDSGVASIFGSGPYLHVPVDMDDGDRLWIRVHAPARLRRRLAARWRPCGTTRD